MNAITGIAMKNETLLLALWFLHGIQSGAFAGAGRDVTDALDQARVDAHKIEQGSESAAIRVVRQTEAALAKIDPKKDKGSLYSWYHGHRTLLIAHRARLTDDNRPNSHDVAVEMIEIAEKGLHPDLKSVLPAQHVIMLEEQAGAYLELACYSLRQGREAVRVSFDTSIEILEKAMRCATTPVEKARINNSFARHYGIAAETRIADAAAEVTTPRTLKEYCGRSAQLALEYTRKAIGIARANQLQSELCLYRCNFMARLDSAHYWRTNQSLRSDSPEYAEGHANLSDSLEYARAHPDDSNCARVLDFHQKVMSLPGIERDLHFERIQNYLREHFKPTTPWYIREY